MKSVSTRRGGGGEQESRLQNTKIGRGMRGEEGKWRREGRKKGKKKKKERRKKVGRKNGICPLKTRHRPLRGHGLAAVGSGIAIFKTLRPRSPLRARGVVAEGNPSVIEDLAAAGSFQARDPQNSHFHRLDSKTRSHIRFSNSRSLHKVRARVRNREGAWLRDRVNLKVGLKRRDRIWLEGG